MKNLYTLYLGLMSSMVIGQELPWKLQPTKDFTQVEPFSEGFATVQKGDKWYFISPNGQLSKDNFAKAYPMSNGASVVQTEDGWRYRDSTSKWIGGTYPAAFDFEEGVGIVQQGNRWGAINVTGLELIPFKYDAIRPFAQHWAGARQGRNVFIINTFGEKKKLPYAFVHHFSENLALVTTKKGQWAYIDSGGVEKIAVKQGRKFASHFGNGLAAVWDTLQDLSYIDPTGKLRFTLKNGINMGQNGIRHYNIFQHQFKEGFAPAQQAGKWGFIDTTGQFVIPCQYDDVTPFSEGFAAVRQGQYWFYINKKHEKIFDTFFLNAKPSSEGLAWVQTEAGWGVLNISERLNIIWESPFKTEENIVKLKISSTRPLKKVKIKYKDRWIEKDLSNAPCYEYKDSFKLDTGKTIFACEAATFHKVQTSAYWLYYQPSSSYPCSGLLIGNDNYEHWNSLGKHPLRDADSLAQQLYENYQFNRLEVLHNATLEQMKTTFEDLQHRKDERLLIFYAGHGDAAPQLGAYFIPTDATKTARKTQFSGKALFQSLQKSGIKHILLIADACYAGALLMEEQRGIITPPLPLKEMERLISRQGMSSGQKIPVPNASIFIVELLGALRNNSDKELTITDLFTKIRTLVMARKAELVPQLGKLVGAGDAGGEFIFKKR